MEFTALPYKTILLGSPLFHQPEKSRRGEEKYSCMVGMKMQRRNPYLSVAFVVVFIAAEATFALAQGSNNGNGSPKGRTAAEEAAATNYTMLASTSDGREVAKCKGPGHCKNRVLTCRDECPVRKPKKNKKKKGCYIDCSSCEAFCKCKPTTSPLTSPSSLSPSFLL